MKMNVDTNLEAMKRLWRPMVSQLFLEYKIVWKC